MIARLLLSRVSPEQRVSLAAWTFDVSLIAWPISHVLFWAMGERSALQHAILALSWFAIVTTCFDALLTSDVRTEQEEA